MILDDIQGNTEKQELPSGVATVLTAWKDETL